MQDETSRRVTLLIMLMIFSLSIAGCAFQKSVSVPVNPKFETLGAYHKQPARIGLLIPPETRSYLYKGKPSGYEYAGLEHAFPLGKALQDGSQLIFAHYFQDVELVTAEEAKNSRLIFEPQIEKFNFRYDMTIIYGGSIPIEYLVPTVFMAVRGTAYGDGKPIWKGSASCPEKKKVIRHQQNLDYSQDLGEVTSQEMACSLEKLTETFAASSELYNFLNSPRKGESK